MANHKDHLTVEEYLREPSESGAVPPPPVEHIVARSVRRRRQMQMMYVCAVVVPLIGLVTILTLRNPEPAQVASVEDLAPVASEVSDDLSPPHPTPEAVGLIVPTGDGGTASLCRSGEEVETYGLEPSSQPTFVGTPEQAVEDYLGSLRIQFSTENPDLRSVSPDALAAYAEYFATYFEPAKNLSAPDSRREGELLVFAKGMDSEEEYGPFQWSSVRVELRSTPEGLYEVAFAAVCGSQLYEDGALLNGPDLPSR